MTSQKLEKSCSGRNEPNGRERTTSRFRFRLSKAAGNCGSPRPWSSLPTGIVPRLAKARLGFCLPTPELRMYALGPKIKIKAEQMSRASNVRLMPEAEPQARLSKYLGWVAPLMYPRSRNRREGGKGVMRLEGLWLSSSREQGGVPCDSASDTRL